MTTHYEAGILFIDHNRCCYGKRLSLKASVYTPAWNADSGDFGYYYL